MPLPAVVNVAARTGGAVEPGNGGAACYTVEADADTFDLMIR
jgi:hypothetical protein